MKILLLFLFILIGCAHNKNTTTCKSPSVIQVPLKLAQCFISENQPLKALSLFEKYSKENKDNGEWYLIEFKSLILLNKENIALNKINVLISQGPQEIYFDQLLIHFEKLNQRDNYNLTLEKAIKLFPENKNYQKLAERES